MFKKSKLLSAAIFSAASLLAFNGQGYRVGYGKGFYDLFLTECRPDCLFVGVNHFNESTDIKDIESHDVPLNCVVTPDQIVRFK